MHYVDTLHPDSVKSVSRLINIVNQYVIAKKMVSCKHLQIITAISKPNYFQTYIFWYGRILFISRKNSTKKANQGNKIHQHNNNKKKIYNYVQL